MKKITAFTSALIAVVLAFSASTFAWFSARNTVTFPTSFGSTQTAYFAGGDGSKESPYLIGSPVHLYNLAWLQYLGYFNQNSEFNNGRAQNFFKLSASINCGGLKIPPIGTEEYPFIGNFDGDGKVLFNVGVSNYGGDLTRRPGNAKFSATDNVLRATDNSRDLSIVGLFGVTGDYGSFVNSNYSAVNVYGTLQAPTVEPATVGENDFYYSAMQVKNFYVSNLSVNSQSAKTLTGLIAGYVCSNVQNTGVYGCDISLNGNASGLEGNGTVVSKYSIVGDYDESVVGWTEKPVSGGEGESAAWGGSIDMRTLNRRLNYMFGRYAQKTGYYYAVTDPGFNFYGFASSGAYWNATNASSGYSTYYLNDGTVLPLNVNISQMGLDEIGAEYNGSQNGNNYKYNDYYKDNSTEIVADHNTGYIVGGGDITVSNYYAPGVSERDNALIVSRVQPIVHTQGINKSVGYAAGKTESVVYNEKNFKMLTIGLDGKTYAVKDHKNANNGVTYSFENVYAEKEYTQLFLNKGGLYKEVRDAFDSSMNGSYMVHGFHFKKQTAFSTAQKTVQIYDVKNGLQTYNNYKLLQGGINFTVAEDGVIKTILGACYNSSNNTLFDLYKVDRSNGSVSWNRVENVYLNASGDVSYVQQDGYDLAFSFNGLTQSAALEKYAAYYFEIPVTAGDYFIGVGSDSLDLNAYLMYLDIGANGGGGENVPGATAAPYNISMVDFVSKGLSDEQLSVPEGANGVYYPHYADVTFSVKDVSGSPARVWYRREDYDETLLPTSAQSQIQTKVLYYCVNAAVAATPQNLASEDETLASG